MHLTGVPTLKKIKNKRLEKYQYEKMYPPMEGLALASSSFSGLSLKLVPGMRAFFKGSAVISSGFTREAAL